MTAWTVFGRFLGKKVQPMKLLRHGAWCQWEYTPVPPFTVQRFSGLLDGTLTIVEEYGVLDVAVLRAWALAYPYQANMIVQIVDARDSIVFSRDGRHPVLVDCGPDGLWLGTRAAFDVLHDMVSDTPLIEFLATRAQVSTGKVCPSS